MNCGHRADGFGRCECLCDDFTKNAPGFCYLQALEDKQEAFFELGEFPTVLEFFKYLSQIQDDRITPFCIYGDGDVVHLTTEDGLEPNNLHVDMVCVQCNKHKVSLCSYFRQFPKECLKCKGVVTVVITPRSKWLSKRVGYNALAEIANSVLVSKEVITDQIITYNTATVVRNIVKISRTDDEVKVEMGEYSCINAVNSQKLRSIKHDYVSSCWTSNTDDPLSLIGIEGPEARLTPDYIDVPSKTIVELSTNESNNYNSMVSAFWGKIRKYKDLCNSVGGVLIVVVVGKTKLISNVQIRSKIIQDMCSRFVEISLIGSSLREVCGFDPTTDMSNDSIKKARLYLSKIVMNPVHDETFPIDDILSFQEEPSAKDIDISRKIMEASLSKAKQVNIESGSTIESYLSRYNESNSTMKKKRVCNFPMVMPTNLSDKQHVNQVLKQEDMPESLFKLWCQSRTVTKEQLEPLEDRILAMNDNKGMTSSKHTSKKRSTFSASLNERDRLELALDGIGGKDYQHHEDKIKKENDSKLSFNPMCDTSDIDTWLTKEWFSKHDSNMMGNTLRQAVIDSKNYSVGGMDQASIKIWKEHLSTRICQFSYFISLLMTEVSINYKQWTFGNRFIRKDIGHGVSLLMYNPKNHLFVSFSIPKSECTILETGRIGPELYDVGTHYISSWSSFDEPSLEHYVKCGPYISSMLIHLQSVSEAQPIKFARYTKSCLPNLLLLYLNNKTDAEELITSQRYLFMKLFEDLPADPNLFIERFPSVLRSRLTSHYVKRTINLITHYKTNRITKIPHQTETMVLYDYQGIKSLFVDEEITLSQKINEFYFGYVVSKERGRSGNRSFKVLSKILEQEYAFRDSNPEMFTKNSIETPKFSTNYHMLKVFVSLFRKTLISRIGEDYKEKIETDFLYQMGNTSFTSLATLKASARDHSQEYKVPEYLNDKSTQEIYEELKKINKSEEEKRPKVLEALLKIIREYENENQGKTPDSISALLPWCLNDLVKQGYFDSDFFEKPQHGGDREIHVLTIKARIVQYHIELISKTVCKFFPSETTVNPDTKLTFVNQHYRVSKEKLGTYQVHSKSADASKWCQAHHTSHFAAFLIGICPESMHPLILNGLSLWPKKCLSFPQGLTSNILSNLNIEMASDLYKRFISEFRGGRGIFTKALSNKIQIKSGMFQGILHHTSSLYHTMIQEVYKQLLEQMCKSRLFVDCFVTVVQGSDDSATMLSLRGALTREQIRMVKTLLYWKEVMSSHFSIYWNVCKSSVGTHDLIEYNSEWYSRHKVIKPTFRWVSASMNLSVTERFIDRFRIMNGCLSDCLEGGASTLECAVIQLNQCCLHYMIMGFQIQDTSEYIWSLLIKTCDPSLGFFPCDYDISAGVTGVEFQLYTLFKNTEYGKSLRNRLDVDVSTSYSPDELPSYMQTLSLRSVKLKQGKTYLYQKFINRLKLEDYQTALDSIEANPSLIFERYTDWENEKYSILLKVFSPGVRESISNVNPLLKLIASSAYIQNFACFVSEHSTGRSTLAYIISCTISKNERTQSKLHESKLFPLSNEFSRVRKMIINIERTSIQVEADFKKTSKIKLLLFDKPNYDFPILDMCRRKWFNSSTIALSNSQFNKRWNDYMEEFTFLSNESGLEGLRSTASNLKMNIVDTKVFLSNLSQRTRSVILYDTSSKSTSLPSTLSRIYWPKIKLFSTEQPSDELRSLRSKMFSLFSYWCPNAKKSHLVERWLKDSATLSLDTMQVPRLGKKMKIIRDYLMGKRKDLLIEEIKSLKQGVIGCFLNRQSGYGENRRGAGLWKGQVCGIPVEMYGDRNICTKIIIQSSQESISLSKSIQNLLNEFNWTLSNEITSSTYMLTSSGRFQTSTGIGVKVIIDKSLSFSHVEDFHNWDWKVEFKDFNLRLKVIENSKGIISEYTILSDRFNSKDWMPNTPISDPDTVLLKWSLGEPCQLNILSQSVYKMIPHRRGAFLKLMKQLKEGKTVGSYNLEFLRQALISAFSVNLRGNERRKDDDLTNEEKTLAAEMYKHVMNLTWDDDDLTREITNWADEVDRDPEALMCEVDESMSSDLEDMIKALQIGSYHESYLEEEHDMRAMPHASAFFSGLNSMCGAVYNSSMTFLLDRCRQDESFTVNGILGKSLSLILREFHISNELDDTEDVADLELEVSLFSGSIKSSDDLERVDLEAIINKISLIESQIVSSEEPRLSALQMVLTKYQRLRDLKISEKEVNESSMISYGQLMKVTVKEIIDKKLVFHEQFPSIESLRIPVLIAILKSEDNPSFNKLSDLERFRITNSIAENLVGIELITLISNTFNIKFTVADKIFGINNVNEINLNLDLVV